MKQAVTMAPRIKKKRLDITVRPDLIDWIDQKITKGDYASRSHAIEKALIKLKEKESDIE